MSNEQSIIRSNELTSKAKTFFQFKSNSFQKNDYFQRKLILQNYFNISENQWNDWTWQLKNRVNTVNQLDNIFHLSPNQYKQIMEVSKRFRFAITPYYLSLINKFDKMDPIFLQSIPQYQELFCNGKTDPMDEINTNPAGAITRRYPDRVIINVTNCCATFCRHCQRRRNIGDTDKCISPLALQESYDYIKNHPEIRDVLITGGDPLTLPDSTINNILDMIRSINTVEIIRIGTRTPVTMPQRITDDLIHILKKYEPIYINTQFNHPLEITLESSAACLSLVNNGIVMGNQMVFLKNINNDSNILQLLNQMLLEIKVRPYYIFHPKNIIGTSHFSISIAEGIKIYEQLRGNTSGLAIPTYIYNAEHGLGKIALNKRILQLVDQEGFSILETWEGNRVKVNILATNYIETKLEEKKNESRNCN